MGISVKESGVVFGEFEAENFFGIEQSNLLKTIGDGIKTVEFIARIAEKDLVFLEAKTGCPNPTNKKQGGIEAKKYDKFYDDIADKMEDSLHVYLSGICENFDDVSEIGKRLLKTGPFHELNLKFVLVITADEIREEWLLAPKLELEDRLRKLMKIWKVKVVVLNKVLAQKYGVVMQE